MVFQYCAEAVEAHTRLLEAADAPDWARWGADPVELRVGEAVHLHATGRLVLRRDAAAEAQGLLFEPDEWELREVLGFADLAKPADQLALI